MTSPRRYLLFGNCLDALYHAHSIVHFLQYCVQTYNHHIKPYNPFSMLTTLSSPSPPSIRTHYHHAMTTIPPKLFILSLSLPKTVLVKSVLIGNQWDLMPSQIKMCSQQNNLCYKTAPSIERAWNHLPLSSLAVNTVPFLLRLVNTSAVRLFQAVFQPQSRVVGQGTKQLFFAPGLLCSPHFFLNTRQTLIPHVSY